MLFAASISCTTHAADHTQSLSAGFDGRTDWLTVPRQLVDLVDGDDAVADAELAAAPLIAVKPSQEHRSAGVVRRQVIHQRLLLLVPELVLGETAQLGLQNTAAGQPPVSFGRSRH